MQITTAKEQVSRTTISENDGKYSVGMCCPAKDLEDLAAERKSSADSGFQLSHSTKVRITMFSTEYNIDREEGKFVAARI